MHDLPSERVDKHVFEPAGGLKQRGEGLHAFDENVRMKSRFSA